jgi:hypothetical protein
MPVKNMNPTVTEEKAMRGVVIDNRSQYVLAEVEDALDRMAAEVHVEVMHMAARGPLHPTEAVAMWYKRLAVDHLRSTLTKQLKGRVNVGRH